MNPYILLFSLAWLVLSILVAVAICFLASRNSRGSTGSVSRTNPFRR